MAPCAVGSTRPNARSAFRRRARSFMTASSSITIRRARRDDVGAIARMLADDPLGSARERIEEPLPPSYFRAFEAIEQASHIQLMVVEDGDGAVIGCLQLCILPG